MPAAVPARRRALIMEDSRKRTGPEGNSCESFPLMFVMLGAFFFFVLSVIYIAAHYVTFNIYYTELS